MLLIVKIFRCITSVSIRKQFLCGSIDNDVVHQKIFTINNILAIFMFFKKLVFSILDFEGFLNKRKSTDVNF